MCGQILQPLKFGIMHKQNSRQQLATCVKKVTYSQAYAPRPNRPKLLTIYIRRRTQGKSIQYIQRKSCTFPHKNCSKFDSPGIRGVWAARPRCWSQAARNWPGPCSGLSGGVVTRGAELPLSHAPAMASPHRSSSKWQQRAGLGERDSKWIGLWQCRSRSREPYGMPFFAISYFTALLFGRKQIW
jgi:hypothetical protein